MQVAGANQPNELAQGCGDEVSSAADKITPDFTNCDTLIVLEACLKCAGVQQQC